MPASRIVACSRSIGAFTALLASFGMSRYATIFVDARVAPAVETVGRRPAGQETQVLHPVARRAKIALNSRCSSRLSRRMSMMKRQTPDGYARDVGEILVGPTPIVDAAGDAALLERRHDVSRYEALVRNQILSVSEATVRFGEALDERRQRASRRSLTSPLALSNRAHDWPPRARSRATAATSKLSNARAFALRAVARFRAADGESCHAHGSLQRTTRSVAGRRKVRRPHSLMTGRARA